MSRKTPLYLAIDQGGHASRALVFDISGKLQATAQAHIATLHMGRNRVEHDPAELLMSIKRACKGIVRQLGARCAHIQAVGLATQRSTIVCWDRETGKALSPVISWQDRRATHLLAALAPYESRVHDITGLVLSPHYGASKIAWCLERLKPVQRALYEGRLAAGPLASFILANLLTEMPLTVDPVNASRTLLWDYRRCDWSEELLALFRIPESILPRSAPNQYPFGHLRLGARAVPLTVVTGDQSAAIFNSGEPDANNIYINIGTGAFLQRPHGDSVPQVPGMLGSVLWQQQARVLYVLEGTVNGAGSAFDWLRKRLGISENKMLGKMPDWLTIKSDIPLFLNGISGLGSPYWISNFRSRFIGKGDTIQKMVAIAESIVFLLCVNLECMNYRGTPVRRIVISGGIARWDGMCQRLADLSGLTVERPVQHEATASGLAWLMGACDREPTESTAYAPRIDAQLQYRYTSWLAELGNATLKSKITS
ncbi:MAG: FGGY family carbohydrate kinase [Gammaproteobacteria bacterium]